MSERKTTLIVVFFFLSLLLIAQQPSPQAGILNLEEYDFTSPLSLAGEWNFYPGVLSSAPWLDADPVPAPIPSPWDDINGTHFGAGTYHLHIRTSGHKGLMSLRIDDNIQAYRISIDGEEVYSTGKVSLTSADAYPGMNGRPAVFLLSGGDVDLTIEMSNWHHRKSGLCKPIFLGTQRTIDRQYRILASLDNFIMGMAFSFFFLYMAFYIKRPEDKVTLWFSLLCLSLGLRTGLTNTSQLENLLGEGWTIICKKLEYLTFISAVLFFVSYIQAMLKKFKVNWFSWIFPIPLYFYGLLIVFTPMAVYSLLLPFFQYYSLVFVVYLFYFFYRGWKEPNEVSYRLIWESTFLISSLIYDILFYNNVLKYGPVTGYSFIIVIFIEGIFQARVLSEVLNRLEILTAKYRKSIEEISQSRMEIEQQNKQLNWLALYDQLTGLPNRYNLTEVLKVEISRAVRNKKKIAVLYMDLDNFKDINDTLGHNKGDDILRLVSERLKSNMRKTDSLFRMGGDEFSLVFTDISHKNQLDSIIEKQKKALSPPVIIRGESFRITVSTGVAFFPDDGPDMDILIKNAELAMYQAKNQGKDYVVSYNDNINNDILSRIHLTNRMKRALEVGHYKLYYQAQINGHTGRLYGFEALIRWIDPEQGVVSPERFIPIAEENGFIAQIGRWTLQEACRQIGEWHGKGYRDFTVSVNISAYQFGLDHFIYDFREILEHSGINPSYLKVELTETMLMANPHLAQRKMEQLQEMGINIALDDFGTGYSSLSYLNIFPVNYLKIDKAFIRDVHRDDFNKKLTTSIISLGKNLDLELIAEGVEREEEKRFVLEQGCRIIQGYVYARPVPALNAEEYFRTFGP